MNASILRRFSATLLANIVGAGMGFAASILMARGLGSAAYGNYNYLLASFAALNSWMEMGSSNAFYTFLSKGKDGALHCRVFSGWLALRFSAVLLVVGLLLPRAWLDRIWFGHDRGLVMLAFAAFFASVPLRMFLIQIAESFRRTVFIQTAIAFLSVAEVGLITTLILFRRLSVPTLFLLLIVEYAALAAYLLRRFDWSVLGPAEPDRSWKDLLRQYGAYCAPLAVYGCISAPCEFADRWLLQYYGGSVQQGFFSISQRFAAIALLATTSLLNIFWKEIAEAERLGDKEKVRVLFRRSARILFFIAAAGACFLIPHSRTLLYRLAGPGYVEAWPALSLMFLFPVFQTLGQLNGTFFFATEDTRTHVIFSSIALLAGLPLTYLVLARFHLGATGLAARLSIFLMVIISAQSWLVAKRQGRPSDNLHYFLVLGMLLAFGWTARTAAAALIGNDLGILALSAPLYAAGVAAFACAYPGQIGLAPGELRGILRRLGESLPTFP